ncbi:multicopper oxidase family protein [Brevirhabdus sp.]|uniref:multicopper oxidase family protein n=1 Tax=Brevirhabdus sp. TaxID=2004514 RepID=UPI0040589BF6
MTLSRRTFLAGTSASLGAGLVATAPAAQTAEAATPAPQVLRAATASLQLAPSGYPATGILAYNDAAPGPQIRMKQGERLSRRLENGLDQATSIHWHGMRLPNAMDGVPGMTQPAVAPGAGFDYDFTLKDAGTFWYHSHNKSWEQVARGLHGPLIVEEPEGAPDVDAEELLVLDDWRLRDDASLDPDYANIHDSSHAGRVGNLITVNAKYDLQARASSGDRLRLRIINASNARIFQLALKGLEGWVVAYDGMPLETPGRIENAIPLAPAQRVDMIVDVTADAGGEAFLIGLERNEGFALTTFKVGEGRRARRDAAPAPLPPNPLPQMTRVMVDAAPVQKLNMSGGAMRALRRAVYKGRNMTGQVLMDEGQFWAFNGMVGMSDKPLAQVARGETLRIPIVNDTVFAHAMHLHGHHFRERLPDGGFGPWRDTLLIAPSETREIAFVADNPGDWMFHCHMLSHQAAGMATWVRVSA